MTTTTTTSNKSATAAVIDRLAALETTPAWGHMGELPVWLDAAAVGRFELPDSVITVAKTALHLAHERSLIVRPSARKPADPDALLAGVTVANILDGDDEHARATSRSERAEALLLAAESALTHSQRDAFLTVRDSLIVNELRAAVGELMEKAKRAAGALAAFGPDYPPALLSEGNAKQLDQWRQSRQLQHDLEVLTHAWQTSWFQATRSGLGTTGVGPALYPQRAGGHYCWVSPDQVNPEALRLGIDSEVLRIATAPSEYRLLAPGELPTLIAELDAAAPRDSRGVSIATTSGHQLVRRGMCE